jgi:hypothetical protein
MTGVRDQESGIRCQSQAFQSVALDACIQFLSQQYEAIHECIILTAAPS